MWPFGSGDIQQPAYAKLMLLPQRPYIPIGPLREALAYPAPSYELLRPAAAATR